MEHDRIPDIYNNRNRKEPPKKKEIKSVVKGGIRQKKQSFGDKLADTFLMSDVNSVVDHIIFNVVVPSLRDMVADTFNGAINMIFYGDKRGPSSSRRVGTNPKVSYSEYYERKKHGDIPERDVRKFSRNGIIELELEDEEDAFRIYEGLKGIFEDYDSVSVKEFYGLLPAGMADDIPLDWNANAIGWFDDDMPNVKIYRGPHRTATLVMPKVKNIK